MLEKLRKLQQNTLVTLRDIRVPATWEDFYQSSLFVNTIPAIDNSVEIKIKIITSQIQNDFQLDHTVLAEGKYSYDLGEIIASDNIF